MFESMQRRSGGPDEAGVDLAPLIDVVFILLIFFLVTATFDPDVGVDVERPEAASARDVAPTALRVVIAPSGATYVDGRAASLDRISADVVRASAGEPVSVLLVPDRTVPSGRLVEVMDAVRLAGAASVTVATRAPSEGRR